MTNFIKTMVDHKHPLRIVLLFIIVALTLSKVFLVGKGFLTFPDEFRYCASGRALKHILALEPKAAIVEIFSTQARPGDVIMKIIPVSFQVISAKILKLYYYESENSAPLFIFNLIVHCLFLFLHFKFSKLILKNDVLALCSVILIATLTNTFIYLRHSLGYDTSLLIFYFVIYKICREVPGNNKKYTDFLLLGFCAFFGYLVYPGYFPLFVISLGLIAFTKFTKETFKLKALQVLSYASGAIICFIAIEVLARFGGRSYIADAKLASSVVKQGSPEESFSFLIKYLFEIEGISGIIIIASLSLYTIFLAVQIKKKEYRTEPVLFWLGISIIGIFLAYASVGYFFNNLYLMGRSLHQYFPFVCVLSVYALHRVFTRYSLNSWWFGIIALIFTVNYSFNLIDYLQYSYPRDVSWQLIKGEDCWDYTSTCEYDNSWSVIPYDEANVQGYINNQRIKKNQNDSVKAVNLCYMYPFDDRTKYHSFKMPPAYKLIRSVPHLLKYKAYQFEGMSIQERKLLGELDLKISIFKKVN